MQSDPFGHIQRLLTYVYNSFLCRCLFFFFFFLAHLESVQPKLPCVLQLNYVAPFGHATQMSYVIKYHHVYCLLDTS